MTLTSSLKPFSRFRCCVGVSSSSQISVSIRSRFRSPLSSSTFPLPAYWCVGRFRRCEVEPTTAAPALRASSASSASESPIATGGRRPFISTPRR